MRWLMLMIIIEMKLSSCGAPSTNTQSSSDNVTAEPPALAVPPPGGLSQPQPAPELANDVWLNSEPLTLAELRKKEQVTLVEFWTFGCYNCRNVLPALRDWLEQYADQGLTIVGVHYPEFSYEHDLENVRQAVEDLEIAYPVAIDNQGETWRAYRQRAWPTMYLIDKQGQIRYVHVGEGAYDTTEQWIRYLLAEESGPSAQVLRPALW